MARQRKPKKPKNTEPPVNAFIAGAGTVVEQPIGETLETNYMPYAMSVIVSRAIPEIDGFKPSHRKLLYTMYKMGLLTGARIKSANIAGQTMQLNPHGEGAIYDTMVRLSRGYEALLHPYVDSKGNFGKAYSRDMQCAAPRYTEAKLDAISGELFRDIDKDTVDFVDNYDATMKEPVLLPVTFPSILVNANTGIAVGMASSICPFNLEEVINTAIEYLKNPEHRIATTLKAPDFPGGGQLIYDRPQLEKIYESGRGSFKMRSVYAYDKTQNCIDISQIPPTTTVEAIIEKIVDLIKQKKISEIGDVRDETGIGGLRVTIDLKRGVDPDRLMQRLFKMTPLQDSFSCNFNILIGGSPRVMGVREILSEWTAFRSEAVRRRVYHQLQKAEQKLHLLKGLSKILLDIDRAIKIVRETEDEKNVVPNLMIGFGIDEIQAEYVAEIKLRHLNREYILNRLRETEDLERQIGEMQAVLEDTGKIREIIIGELRDVAAKYAQPRKTELYYPSDEDAGPVEEEIPDYPVHLFFTKEGYFKKIIPQSLRMSGEQKLKEGDSVLLQVESANSAELLFFTNQCKVYKSRVSDWPDTKASVLGEYVAGKLEMEEGETAVYMAVTADYGGYILFVFENGKVAKVELKSYETQTRRKKLLSAYSDKSPLVAVHQLPEDAELLLQSSDGRALLCHTAFISLKTTRSTQGVAVITAKRGRRVVSSRIYQEGMFQNPHRYRTKSIPAAGKILAEEEKGEQMEFPAT